MRGYKSFIEMIIDYGDKLVKKEKEKFLNGNRNNYYRFEDELNSLKLKYGWKDE